MPDPLANPDPKPRPNAEPSDLDLSTLKHESGDTLTPNGNLVRGDNNDDDDSPDENPDDATQQQK
jgi:hypothetical protein